MKKKAKVDWRKVWPEFDELTSPLAPPWSKQKILIEGIVDEQLSHKPKKVKGRKKN